MVTNLVGYWEHGKDIKQIWYRAYPDNTHQLAIYDEDPNAGILPAHPLRGRIIFGMNNPSQREAAEARFGILGADPLVDPSAIIGRHVVLGFGSVIAPTALLFHDVHIGDHVHIHYSVSMVRTTIESFSTVSPGATICGDVSIGTASTIGAGATVCNGVTIGSYVVVAAGAVVPPFTVIPDDEIWAGVPAKKLDKDRSSITELHRQHGRRP